MIAEMSHRLRGEISKTYIGKESDIDMLIIALLTGGHVLIEGMPGLAKTTLVNTLAKAVDASFRRVQFTSDLMPSDITGGSVYNIQSNEFKFVEGPVFTNILLADEINRAPARTQSALLEAMQEKQVTVDGVTRRLPDMFFVAATQNTEDERGIYELPLSQLDRFMFRIRLFYPSAEQETRILMNAMKPSVPIEAVITPQAYQSVILQVEDIHIAPQIVYYISRLIRATRERDDIIYGASPRAGVMMMKAARGRAFCSGRDYVSPDDVRDTMNYVLNHRIVLNDDESTVDDVLDDILNSVKFE